MAQYQMQARSSTDGLMYSWNSATRDFGGSGFPGPGTAQHVAVQRAVRDDVMVSVGNGDELGKKIEWNGSIWVKKRGWITPDVDLTGATDGSAAITAALNSRVGACVELPDGTVKITSGLLGTTSYVKLLGNRTTILVDSVAAIDALTFQGVLVCGVENVKFVGNRVYTAGAAVKFSGSTKCHAIDVTVNDMANGFDVLSSSVTRIVEPDVRGMFGTYGIRYRGTSGSQCHQLHIVGPGNLDNPYPGSVDGHAHRLWATGTVYVAGDTVLANGNIYYCLTGGTSAGSGTGPSGIPGTTVNNARSTGITDNTVTWYYVGALITWISHEEWANSISIAGAIGCLNGGYGYRSANNDGSPGSDPTSFIAQPGFACDHSWGNGIELNDIADVAFIDTWVSSTMFGSGVHVPSTFGGTFRWRGGQVFGSAKHGFQMEAGHWNIDGANVSCSSGAAGNTYDAVNVAAGVSNWSVKGGTLGFLGAVTETQRGGVVVEAGASDNYEIQGVRFGGNLSGGIVDNGTGKGKKISNNQGNNEEHRPPVPGMKFGGFLNATDQTVGVADGNIFKRVGTAAAARTYTVSTFAGSTGFSLWFENYDTAFDHNIDASTTFTFARGKGYRLDWNGSDYALAQVYILQGY